MFMLKPLKPLDGFITFVREQGVVGLAVGFILGGSVTLVVNSLVRDIIDPILGIILGAAGNLSDAVIVVGGATIRYGSFLNVCIDFLVIAAVVYFGVTKLGLDKLDKKKQ